MAIENNEYTSMMIKKSTKQQLDKLKNGKSISYSDVVENLIQQTGGCIVDDVIEISREQTAFTLKYWDGTGVNKIRDITYKELRDAYVGQIFNITEVYPDSDVGYVSASAKVMVNDGVDVILLVTETSCRDGVNSSIKSVVHIELF